nr:uncharacterized protein LOC132436432 [Delphinus delphis]
MTSTPWTSRCSPRPGFPLYSEAISFPSPRGEVGMLGAPSPSPKLWGTGPAPVLPPPLPRLPLHLGEERAVRAPALATGGQPQGHGVVLSSVLRDRTQPSKRPPALFGRLTVVAGDPEQRDAAQAKQPGSPSVTRTRAHHPPLARTLIHPEAGIWEATLGGEKRGSRKDAVAWANGPILVERALEEVRAPPCRSAWDWQPCFPGCSYSPEQLQTPNPSVNARSLLESNCRGPKRPERCGVTASRASGCPHRPDRARALWSRDAPHTVSARAAACGKSSSLTWSGRGSLPPRSPCRPHLREREALHWVPRGHWDPSQRFPWHLAFGGSLIPRPSIFRVLPEASAVSEVFSPARRRRPLESLAALLHPAPPPRSTRGFLRAAVKTGALTALGGTPLLTLPPP